LPGGASAYIADDFHIVDPLKVALPLVVYLVGYVFGPLMLSPLSEFYGRKRTLIASELGFLGASIGCASSPTFGILVIFRALAGVAAAIPLTVIGGVYADIMEDPKSRGKATAAYTVVSPKDNTMQFLLTNAAGHSGDSVWAYIICFCFNPRVEMVLLANKHSVWRFGSRIYLSS
jgi:MFS family permease